VIARLEFVRLCRSRRPLLAIGALVFFLGMMLLGFYTYALTETDGAASFRYTFENSSYFNGLTFSLYAFYFSCLLILPIFAATEAGTQLAGDAASGRLKLMLTRPISRSRIFFWKLCVMVSMCASLVACLLALSLTLGLIFVGWGDLDLYPGVLQMSARHQHLPQSDALWAFLLAWPAATISLLAPLSFSVLISTWARNGVNAVGLSVSAYLVLYVIAEIHFFKELRPWLFTSSMSYWRGLFREDVDWAELLDQGARLIGFSFLFLALAFRRFRNREEL
jgi:ABC-2 type transport system permease protein